MMLRIFLVLNFVTSFFYCRVTSAELMKAKSLQRQIGRLCPQGKNFSKRRDYINKILKPIQKKLSIEGYKRKERKKELVEDIFANYSEDCAVQDLDTKDVDAEDDATVTTTRTLVPVVEVDSTRGSPPHSISGEDSISPLYFDVEDSSRGLLRHEALASPHAGQVTLEDGLEELVEDIFDATVSETPQAFVPEVSTSVPASSSEVIPSIKNDDRNDDRDQTSNSIKDDDEEVRVANTIHRLQEYPLTSFLTEDELAVYMKSNQFDTERTHKAIEQSFGTRDPVQTIHEGPSGVQSGAAVGTRGSPPPPPESDSNSPLFLFVEEATSDGLNHPSVSLAPPRTDSTKEEDDCEDDSVKDTNAEDDCPDQSLDQSLEANDASQSKVQVCGECMQGKENSRQIDTSLSSMCRELVSIIAIITGAHVRSS